APAAVTLGGGPPAPRRRRPLRTALLALAAVVVLGAVAIGSYLFVMGHWFVGVQEDAAGQPVAVFQGLHASIVGVNLYRVDAATSMGAADLTPAARSRVTAGITADDRADAQRILANLRGQQLPLCRTTPRTTAPSTTTDDAPTTPTTPTTPPPPTPPTEPGLTPQASPVTISVPAPDTTTGSTSASPTRTGGSEVDCREAD
ncbi:MAG: pstP, partial [Modestobacter sp.]|nr:pstP [Modestobacter sp.]